ncbi:MAG: M23 family metallopeptidase [Bacilli bacterium]|nr:M23 family metallopeptidase [Bacilli bacterium]
MKAKEIIITTLLVILVCGLFALNFLANKLILRADSIYRVYLDGNIIGYIEDDEELYNIINQRQREIKEKYGVDEVHPPENFEIVKSNSYNVTISSAEEIYAKVAKLDSFTIEGYIVTAENEEENTKVVINVLDKTIFDEAINNFVLAFIDQEDYTNYMNDTQPVIETTGKIIELVYFDETIKIKKGLMSVDDVIYTDKIELSQYLLFGKDYKINYYTVKEGDTIESVAENNKLNAQEFLIANTKYASKDSLLKIGDKVNITLIDPVLTLTYEVNEVSDTKIPFQKKVEYDKTKPVTFSEITTVGVTGITRVTQQYIVKNGQTQQGAVITDKVVITEKVDQITTKGGYYSSGGGSYVDTGKEWGWPTNYPYVITSGFGYRWGSLHPALDISGTGYGSPIYAANDGTVVSAGYEVQYCGAGGNCVVLLHDGNYYSQYAHMAYVTVKPGDTVTKGQIIGAMGNSGVVSPMPSPSCPTCGTHLHFGVFNGNPYRGTPINPLRLYS